MKNRLVTLLLILGLFAIFAVNSQMTYAQTEGFDVKTPTQKIADNSEALIKHLTEDSKNNHKDAIPKELICGSMCMIVIPDVTIDEVRKDFDGTGLMSCVKMNSDDLTPPLYYEINELESFYENNGDVIIFVTDHKDVKSVLGNSEKLTSDNSEPGKVGSATDFQASKSYVTYAKQTDTDDNTEGYDLSGSSLVYSNKDTFKEYQETLIPIDILLHSEDIPPTLRGFDAAVKEYRSMCK